MQHIRVAVLSAVSLVNFSDIGGCDGLKLSLRRGPLTKAFKRTTRTSVGDSGAAHLKREQLVSRRPSSMTPSRKATQSMASRLASRMAKHQSNVSRFTMWRKRKPETLSVVEELVSDRGAANTAATVAAVDDKLREHGAWLEQQYAQFDELKLLLDNARNGFRSNTSQKSNYLNLVNIAIDYVKKEVADLRAPTENYPKLDCDGALNGRISALEDRYSTLIFDFEAFRHEINLTVYEQEGATMKNTLDFATTAGNDGRFALDQDDREILKEINDTIAEHNRNKPQ
jgi:hypothetical protein